MAAALARRAGASFALAGVVAVMVLGTAILATGCGGGSSGRAVTSLGPTTIPAGSSAAASANKASVFSRALAFAQCMRSHGEPNFPDPVRQGNSAHETISPDSGVDPNSPQFTAARNACKHLLPNNGAPGPSPGQTLTPAEQADYLKAAACMRKHGIPDFPDPTFQNGTVSFNSQTPIDTNTPQYKRAVTICQKLIPAGLPYSSSSGQ
jgi:hypothetical protein